MHVPLTRRLVAPLVAVLALTGLAGCGGSDEVGSTTDDDTTAADEVVRTAVEPVLGDGPFRVTVSGAIPFFSVSMAVRYEQSGGDALDVTAWGSYATATAVVGDSVHQWDSWEGRWRETPLDSYDPLMGPSGGYFLSLMGLLDVPDETDGFEDLADLDPSAGDGASDPGGPPGDFADPDELEVATGWTETTGSDGLRRFERTLDAGVFEGEGPGDDAPAERHEERAITSEYYRHATVTSIVEIDADGRIVRHVLRHDFDGSPDHPDCGPLERLVGATELVLEYRDVGVDFAITVPETEELVATHPSLAEPPEFTEDALDEFDSAFRDDAGERDLAGCPTP